MFAVLPFFTLPVYEVPIGGYTLPIDPWATLVCIGFIVGLEFARHRGIKLGMDVRDVVDAAVFIVLSGFAVGHIVTVVAYQPERLQTEGIWAILKFWTGFSSFGGFLGAILGAIAFYFLIRKRPFWRYADVIGWGFPFGWVFGRLGCGVVHDHIGRLTDFPLAMDFPAVWNGEPYMGTALAGPRHELGLYEAAYMMLVSALFFSLGRRDWPPGFFLGLLATCYAPVRFAFDFLRNSDLGHADPRYAYLTPAQWGAIVMFGLGLAILATRDYKGFTPHPLDGSSLDPQESA